jgi:hypothetical protein
MKLPVSFKEKLREPKKDGGGYPVQIKADDLDKNFLYAALDADETLVEITKSGANSGRKLKIPAVPETGSRYLSARNGEMSWSGLGSGDNEDQGEEGDVLYHDGEDWVRLSRPESGLHVLAIDGGVPFWLGTEECEEE